MSMQESPSLRKIAKALSRFSNSARKIYFLFSKEKVNQLSFPGSQAFWDERYKKGDTSGVGSYGKFAEFKSQILNSFVKGHNVDTVIEFGCGDGNQLGLAEYPHYIGFDVSGAAIKLCQEKFSNDTTKSFYLTDYYEDQSADLSLSLDVIYHLIEDDIFEKYMHLLFQSSKRFVIIYSSDTDDNCRVDGSHVRHRKFSDWIETNAKVWSLIQRIPNKYPFAGDYKDGSFSDFFVYKKCDPNDLRTAEI